MKKMMHGKATGGSNTAHPKGMHNKSPMASDASTKLRGKSVNDGATRAGTAAHPRTLGPRTA